MEMIIENLSVFVNLAPRRNGVVFGQLSFPDYNAILINDCPQVIFTIMSGHGIPYDMNGNEININEIGNNDIMFFAYNEN